MANGTGATRFESDITGLENSYAQVEEQYFQEQEDELVQEQMETAAINFQKQSFIKARNQLNSEEHKNYEMFSTINEKLTDHEFISIAIDEKQGS